MQRGGGHRGGSARGRGGGRGGHQKDRQQGPQKKEPILDLSKYMNQEISVKFVGGREVQGTLKGFDALLNLVLDSVTETIVTAEQEIERKLGLVVCRGTAVILICPADGKEQIANPFLSQ